MKFNEYTWKLFKDSQAGAEVIAMFQNGTDNLAKIKALFEAYCQAKSYALRLQTKAFILVAKEGLWIFSLKHNNYDFNKFVHYSWNELQHPDIFHQILLLIGKKTILGRE